MYKAKVCQTVLNLGLSAGQHANVRVATGYRQLALCHQELSQRFLPLHLVKVSDYGNIIVYELEIELDVCQCCLRCPGQTCLCNDDEHVGTGEMLQQ